MNKIKNILQRTVACVLAAGMVFTLSPIANAVEEQTPAAAEAVDNTSSQDISQAETNATDDAEAVTNEDASGDQSVNDGVDVDTSDEDLSYSEEESDDASYPSGSAYGIASLSPMAVTNTYDLATDNLLTSVELNFKVNGKWYTAQEIADQGITLPSGTTPVQFKLKYDPSTCAFSHEDGDVNTLTYTIPSDFTIADDAQCRSGKVYDSGDEAGTYEVKKDSSGNEILTITLDNDYLADHADKVNSGYVSMEGGFSYIPGPSTEKTITFSTGIKFTIPVEKEVITTHKDLKISKAAANGIKYDTNTNKYYMDYTITVTAPSTNTDDVTDITVKDSVQNTDYFEMTNGHPNYTDIKIDGASAASKDYSQDGSTWVFALPTMTKGTTHTITYRAWLTDSIEGKTISNTSKAYSGKDPKNEDTVSTTFKESVSVKKTNAGITFDGKGGATLTYTVTISTGDGFLAKNLYISDLFTDNASYVTSVDQSSIKLMNGKTAVDMTGLTVTDSKNIAFTFAAKAGKHSYTLTYTANLDYSALKEARASKTIKNVVTVKRINSEGTQLATAYSTATTDSSDKANVTKSNSGYTFATGDYTNPYVTYTVTITNPSKYESRSIYVADTFGTNKDYISSIEDVKIVDSNKADVTVNNLSIDNTNKQITFTIPSMPANSTYTLTYKCKLNYQRYCAAKSEVTISNNVSLKSQTSSGTELAKATSNMTKNSSDKANITKDNNGYYYETSDGTHCVDYTITVENDTDFIASDYYFYDNFTDGEEYVTSLKDIKLWNGDPSATGTTDISSSMQGLTTTDNNITFTIPAMQPHTKYYLTYTAVLNHDDFVMKGNEGSLARSVDNKCGIKVKDASGTELATATSSVLVKKNWAEKDGVYDPETGYVKYTVTLNKPAVSYDEDGNITSTLDPEDTSNITFKVRDFLYRGWEYCDASGKNVDHNGVIVVAYYDKDGKQIGTFNINMSDVVGKQYYNLDDPESIGEPKASNVDQYFTFDKSVSGFVTGKYYYVMTYYAKSTDRLVTSITNEAGVGPGEGQGYWHYDDNTLSLKDSDYIYKECLTDKGEGESQEVQWKTKIMHTVNYGDYMYDYYVVDDDYVGTFKFTKAELEGIKLTDSEGKEIPATSYNVEALNDTANNRVGFKINFNTTLTATPDEPFYITYSTTLIKALGFDKTTKYQNQSMLVLDKDEANKSVKATATYTYIKKTDNYIDKNCLEAGKTGDSETPQWETLIKHDVDEDDYLLDYYVTDDTYTGTFKFTEDQLKAIVLKDGNGDDIDTSKYTVSAYKDEAKNRVGFKITFNDTLKATADKPIRVVYNTTLNGTAGFDVSTKYMNQSRLVVDGDEDNNSAISSDSYTYVKNTALYIGKECLEPESEWNLNENPQWQTSIKHTVTKNDYLVDYNLVDNDNPGEFSFTEDQLKAVTLAYKDGTAIDSSKYTVSAWSDTEKGLAGYKITFNDTLTVANDNWILVTYNTALDTTGMKYVDTRKYQNQSKLVLGGDENNSAIATANYTFQKYQDISKTSTGCAEGVIPWTVTINAKGTMSGTAVVTDVIPDGLAYVEDSFKVEVGSDAYVTDAEGNKTASSAEATVTTDPTTGKETLTVNYTNLNASKTEKAYVKVTYETKVTDEDLLDGKISEETFTNTANLNPDEGGPTATSDVKVEAVKIDKKGYYDKYTAPYRTYTVELNEDGLDLQPDPDKTTIRFIDWMGDDLQLDPTSIEVKDEDGKAVNYSLEYPFSYTHTDASGQEVTEDNAFALTVPDNQHLTLTYRCYVYGLVGDKVDVVNNAAFEGTETVPGEDEENIELVEANAGVEGDLVYSFYKVDSNTDAPLAGAEYTLYKVTLVDGKLNYERMHTFTTTLNSKGTVAQVNFTTYTDDSGKEVKLDKNTVYAVMETKAPNGYYVDFLNGNYAHYAFSRDIENFDAINEILGQSNIAGGTGYDSIAVIQSGYKATRYNEKGSITVNKTFTGNVKDGTYNIGLFTSKDSDTYVRAAQIVVQDGKVVSDVTFKNLDFGTYYIYELDDSMKKASETSAVCNGAHFIITGQGTEAVLSESNPTKTVTINNEETARIKLRKVDSHNALKFLNNAVFTVYSDEACTTSVGTMTTKTEKLSDGELVGVAYSDYLSLGTYYVKETKAPLGYKLDSTVYPVTLDANTNLNHGGIEVLNAGNDVPNDETSVDITKYDVTNQKEVAGAHIQVLYTDEKVFDEWDSTTAAHTVTGLETGVTYTLRETIAPLGYAITSDTTFILNENGTINADETTTTIGAEGTDLAGVLLVEDDALHFNVNKVDVTNDKELVGAKLQIFKQGKDGKATGEAIATWISKENETVDFGQYLEAGKSYILRESLAPVGYDAITDTPFSVALDGTLTVTTGNGVKETTDSEGNKVYLVQDMPQTEYAVEKIWDDNNDNDKYRPTEIKVQLYRDGEPYGDAKTLTATNSWKCNWTGLSGGAINNGTYSKYTYSVYELDTKGNKVLPAHSYDSNYIATYDTTTANTTKITNKHDQDKTSIEVTKDWNDSELRNATGYSQPQTITVDLYESYENVLGITVTKKVDSKTITASGNWKVTFEDLPTKYEGKDITYTAKEVTPDAYTSSGDATAENNYVITNTPDTDYNVTPVTLNLYKKDVNTDKPLKGAVFTVYNSKNEVVGTSTATGANGKTTFDFTTEMGAGTYTIVETTSPDGYSMSGIAYKVVIDKKLVKVEKVNNKWVVYYKLVINDDLTESYKDGTLVVDNTPTPTYVDVKKVWTDDDKQDSDADTDRVQPESIDVQLYKQTINDEKPIAVAGCAATLDASNDWFASFSDLPSTESGYPITYTIKESLTTDQYELTSTTKTGTGTADNHYLITLTNTHKTERTNVSVEKAWDFSDYTGNLPSSIKLTLYANGEVVNRDDATVTLTPGEDGTWDASDLEYTWEGLNKNYEGDPIEYTVDETDIGGKTPDQSGYLKVVGGDQTKGYTVTNTLTRVEFLKKDDKGNAVSGCTLQLLNGTEVVDEWVTDGTAHVEYGLLAGVTYTLHESDSPAGWGYAEDIQFVLNEKGDMLDMDGNPIASNALVMTDKSYNFHVDKVDVTTSEEVAGATITIYLKNADGTETAVDSWVSDGESNHDFTKSVLAGKDYVLEETVTPVGYGLSTSGGMVIDEEKLVSRTDFSITKDGTVVCGLNTTTDADGNTVYLVEDQKINFHIDKVDVTNDEEVAGATITVYDSEGNVVDTWVSDANGSHDFGKLLTPGKDYVLEETIAPDGYGLSTSGGMTIDEEKIVSRTNFTIEADGTVICGLNTTTDEEGNVVDYLIEDQPTKEVYIEKENEDGTPLSGAELAIFTPDENGDWAELDRWTTDGTKHEISGLNVNTSYKLVEITAPEGKLPFQDVYFTLSLDGTQVIVDGAAVEDNIIVAVDKDREYGPGSLSVTKDLYYATGTTEYTDPDGISWDVPDMATAYGMAAVDETFYVALYEDEAMQTRVSDIMPIHYEGTSTQTVTFDNLVANKQYYVAECDASGVAVYQWYTVKSSEGNIYYAHYDVDESQIQIAPVTVTEGTTQSVRFGNYTTDLPDGYFVESILNVTKNLVDKNGTAKKANKTFYAGIFTDEALTTAATEGTDVEKNLLTLNLNGDSTVTASTKVYLDVERNDDGTVKVDDEGNPIAVPKTLYITETDETGAKYVGGKEYAVTVTGGTAAFTAANQTLETTIENKEYPTSDDLSSSLKIVKNFFDASGKAKTTKETFYAGIFTDAACTELANEDVVSSNIVALKMNGASTTSSTVKVQMSYELDSDGNVVKDDDGNPVIKSQTLYVTETDKNGKAVNSSYTYTYEVTGGTVTLTKANDSATVTINNSVKSSSSSKSSSSGSSKTGTTSVKTGDTAQTTLWFAVLCAGLVAATGTTVYRRKRKA